MDNSIIDNKKQADEYINKIKNSKTSPVSPIRIPICLILDLSYSMTEYISIIKTGVSSLYNSLSQIPKTNFSLIIIAIHSFKNADRNPVVCYCGDLKNFNVEEFIDGLPQCSGPTHLVSAWSEADNYTNLLTQALDKAKAYYTVPFFISFSDSKNNDSEASRPVINIFSDGIRNNNRLVAQFITEDGGINIGGYRIPINTKNSYRMIEVFMKCLRIASSTANNNNVGTLPPKRDRVNYNLCRSEILINEFHNVFQKEISMFL